MCIETQYELLCGHPSPQGIEVNWCPEVQPSGDCPYMDIRLQTDEDAICKGCRRKWDRRRARHERHIARGKLDKNAVFRDPFDQATRTIKTEDGLDVTDSDPDTDTEKADLEVKLKGLQVATVRGEGTTALS